METNQDNIPEEELAELTQKQQRFVEEYCIHFNATRAAIKAGYSEDSARAIGCENLTKPNIKQAIDIRVKSMTMTADEALLRMTDLARGSFESFLEVDDNQEMSIMLNSDEAKSKLHLIKKIKQTKRRFGEDGYDVITEIELHDSKDAIAKILQMHGKLIEKVDHTTNGEKIEQTTIIFSNGVRNE
jgi:phage terminase small subunit